MPSHPEDEDSDQPSVSSRPGGVDIPKTRSASASARPRPHSSHSSSANLAILHGASFDAAASSDYLARSPILGEHEALGLSGLQRIRQPNPRVPSASSRSAVSTRPPSMTLPPVPSLSDLAGSTSLMTPALTMFGEDLNRFPSESLHSFSFSGPAEDYVQTRHNALKRSIELLRDKGSWAAGGLGIAAAQAKLNGDADVQRTMAMLNRANLLDEAEDTAATAAATAAQHRSGFFVGPMTGPALLSSDNVFEQNFAHRTESPTSFEEDGGGTIGSASHPEQPRASTPAQSQFDLKVESPCSPHDTGLRIDTGVSHAAQSSVVEDDTPRPATADRPRLASSLRRTYTDTEPLYLKERVSEALAQPYMAAPESVFSPTLSSIATAFPLYPLFSSAAPHSAHGRGAPTTQAIFTTSAEDPWTISAANDMACLIFGVTKAELKKIGILDLIQQDKREWLSSRLRAHAASKSQSKSQPASPAASPRAVSNGSFASAMGNGLTARLLSKPPSRHSPKRSSVDNTIRTADSSNSFTSDQATGNGAPLEKSLSDTDAGKETEKNGGVVICGDVLPVRKMNGDGGSASMWVQEKRSGLIWVVEEIAEDISMLTVDEIGSVVRATGASEAVWGMERVRKGMDITRLLPSIPRVKGTNTGALDFDQIHRLRRFTARTANDISVPVTVDQIAGESTFRVSSFPNIAGMLVLSASTLNVKSCNGPVSEALFGMNTTDMPITDIIPGFDKMLALIKRAEEVQLHNGNLVEGMVIPADSFRRARSRLAHDEGKAEMAAYFLRPSGVPAMHRDGAQVMIDVQMRVVKSESLGQSGRRATVDAAVHMTESSPSEVVYALWVTYSRTVHAANHGTGPLSPLVSRPGTPPHQPFPSVNDFTLDLPDAVERTQGKPTALERIPEAPLDNSNMAPAALQDLNSMPPPPRPVVANGKEVVAKSTPADTTGPAKKTIADFQILEEMGAGAYGQVRLARYKRFPHHTAVVKYVVKKRILVDTWTRDRRLGTVPLEIHVLDFLRRLGDDEGTRHPNIVEMSDFFEDETNYYIEMVPHGIPGMDLFDYIELRVNMDEDEARRIFTQVASAVEFLHTRAKVVHRDIKDENIILDGEGQVKLIDFGSASYLRNGPFDVFVGTIDYAAPEVLAGDSYDGPEQDVWALGILLYTIIYKENPFYSIDEIMDHDLRVPYVVSEASIDLIRRMLNREVSKRPTISEVMNHEWCQGGRELKGHRDWRQNSGIAIVESERKT